MMSAMRPLLIFLFSTVLFTLIAIPSSANDVIQATSEDINEFDALLLEAPMPDLGESGMRPRKRKRGARDEKNRNDQSGERSGEKTSSELIRTENDDSADSDKLTNRQDNPRRAFQEDERRDRPNIMRPRRQDDLRDRLQNRPPPPPSDGGSQPPPPMPPKPRR